MAVDLFAFSGNASQVWEMPVAGGQSGGRKRMRSAPSSSSSAHPRALAAVQAAQYVPLATRTLDFYAAHYPNRSDDGKLLLWPTQVGRRLSAPHLAAPHVSL